jgi:hypothetical protein
MMPYSDVNMMNVKYEGIDYMPPISGNFSSSAEDGLFNDKASVMQSSYIQLGISGDQTVRVGDEKTDGSAVCRNMTWQSGGVTEALDRKCSWSDGNGAFVDEDKKQSSSGFLSSVQSQKHVIYTKDERGCVTIGSSRDQVEGVVGRFPAHNTDLQCNSKYKALIIGPEPCAFYCRMMR